MKVPFSWLKEFLGEPISHHALSDLLTELGLEVEGLTYIGEGLSGVEVAEIEAVAPLGERVRRVVLHSGSGRQEVVSGAPNLRPGLKVAWARPGASLPGGRTIETVRVLGATSHGMLLSAEEMGIGPEREGVLELPPDAPIGEDVGRLLGLPEAVLEIGLTPSFATFAQSVVGVAREVAAKLGVPLTLPETPQLEPWDPFPFVAPDPSACTQYLLLAARVEGSCPSPLWLKRRLWAAGMRTRALAVDLTNYLMLEWGHPIHAFDAERLTAPLTVREARRGERILLLDGREISLEDGDLVVADAEGPVALAGVMGGQASAVGDETRKVLFECASFPPRLVRRTALRHGLRTEAMARFEKGVDPEDWPKVLGRLAHILEGEGAQVLGMAASFGAAAPPRRPLTLSLGRVAKLLGVEVPRAAVEDALTRLGMAVKGEGDVLSVVPPSYRLDIGQEADLVEEVGRFLGYQILPEVLPPATSVGRPSLASERRRRLVELWAHFGFTEVLNFSWIDASEAEVFLPPDGVPVRLKNPLREGEEVLRTSLLPRLVRAVAQNLAYQEEDVRLVEAGRVFWRSPSGEVREEERLALAATGDLLVASPTTPGRPLDVLALKGLVESFFRHLGRTDVALSPSQAVPYLHPGRALLVVAKGRTIGAVGELHPRLGERYDLPRRVVVAEFSLDALHPGLPRPQNVLPKFPSVRRDLALVVPEGLPYAELEAAIRAADIPELVRVRLFDLYRGPNIPAGTKSFAVSLWFRSETGTLTDAHVDTLVARVLDHVAKIGARLRGEEE